MSWLRFSVKMMVRHQVSEQNNNYVYLQVCLMSYHGIMANMHVIELFTVLKLTENLAVSYSVTVRMPASCSSTTFVPISITL